MAGVAGALVAIFFAATLSLGLAVVAVAAGGEIASFCTVWFDDVTRTGYFEPVATVPEHQRRGLGKAVLWEGFKKLQRMGCTRVFATAYDPPADALYGSVMSSYVLAETWLKEL